MAVVKEGTVFAGKKSPDIHNEIVKIYYNEKRRKMVDVEQYGATLETKEHNTKVTFYMTEIYRVLKNGQAHVVLAR